MASVAQQVVAALKTRLLAGAVVAAGHAHTDRNWPLEPGDLPALRIFEQDEGITPETIHWPRLLTHELQLSVEMCAQATSGIDEALAAMRLAIDEALFDSIDHATLGQPGLQLAPRGVGPMQPVEGADRQIARRTYTLLAKFRTLENAPEAFA